MKLISLNICIKIDNSVKIAKFIESEKPDIVAFQEIVRHFDETVSNMYKSKYDIEKRIGKLLPYHFFGPLFMAKTLTKDGKIHRDFGGHVEQGNEIMSRFPITNATNEHYHKKYSYDIDRTNFEKEDHPRAVQIVELDVNGKKLQVLNIHGLYSKEKHDNERTIKQCEYVLNAAKRNNLPTIVVGDFNLLPSTESIKIMNKEFRNLISEYNISSTVPEYDHGTEPKKGKFVMDYIFVNNKIKVNDFKIIDTTISDHLPLMIDFEIKD